MATTAAQRSWSKRSPTPGTRSSTSACIRSLNAILQAALQEDVEAVGLSILSGAHMTLFPAVIDLLRKNGMGDVLVFGGGIIPQRDVEALKAAGVGKLFTPGADTREIVAFLDDYFAKKSPSA
jgi:methylmalonyl-CoA mutase C-terminal domain/subunit